MDIGGARRRSTRSGSCREHGLRAIALDPVEHHSRSGARAPVAEAGVRTDRRAAGRGSRRCRSTTAPRTGSGAATCSCTSSLRAGSPNARGSCGQAAGCSHTSPARPTGSSSSSGRGCSTRLRSFRRAPTRRSSKRARKQPASSLVSKAELGGEWRERMLEDGTWSANDDLLRLSRLRRRGANLDDPRVAAYSCSITPATRRRWPIWCRRRQWRF